MHAVLSENNVFNRRPPRPHEGAISTGDGRRRPVSFFGDLVVVLHSIRDVMVTLRDVAVVPGLAANFISFALIQDRHRTILDHTGASLLDGTVQFTKFAAGNYIHATEMLPGAATAASFSPPGNSGGGGPAGESPPPVVVLPLGPRQRHIPLGAMLATELQECRTLPPVAMMPLWPRERNLPLVAMLATGEPRRVAYDVRFPPTGQSCARALVPLRCTG